jgi:hypothetical protein
MTDRPTTAYLLGAPASLVAYRRQLLADAKKERAAMQRLVRRCEKALDEAVMQMSATIIAADVKDLEHAD